MKKDKELEFKMEVLYVIQYCFVLTCFTIIACVTNHWWVILLSLLFVLVEQVDEDQKDKKKEDK